METNSAWRLTLNGGESCMEANPCGGQPCAGENPVYGGPLRVEMNSVLLRVFRKERPRIMIVSHSVYPCNQSSSFQVAVALFGRNPTLDSVNCFMLAQGGTDVGPDATGGN